MRLPEPSPSLLPFLTKRNRLAAPILGDPILRRLVGQFHVGQSGLRICRSVILRLRRQRRTFLSLPKASRRLMLCVILAHHHTNRQLYRSVMSGSMR